MEKVDLDDAQDTAEWWLRWAEEEGQEQAAATAATMRDMAVELRAAREVVDAGRAIVAPAIPHEQRWTTLRRVLAAYDETVASPLTTPTRRP